MVIVFECEHSYCSHEISRSSHTHTHTHTQRLSICVNGASEPELLSVSFSYAPQWLMERSRALEARLAEYVVLRSRTQAKAVCAQYDSIVSRVSAQSQSTRQLVDLQRYIDSITYTELVDLKERLRVTAENVLFLIENAPLPGGVLV